MKKCNESLLSSFGFLVLVAFLRFTLLREGMPAVVPILVNFGTIVLCSFGLYNLVVSMVWVCREVDFRKGFGFSAPSPGDWAKREASLAALKATLRTAAAEMDAAFTSEKSLNSQMENAGFNEQAFASMRIRVHKAKKQFWRLHGLAVKFGYSQISNEYRDFL